MAKKMHALCKSKTNGEFSVYWWDPDGRYYAEKRFCGVEEAGETAKSLITRPAAKLGIIQRVMITDGGDLCAFEWKFKKGVIFPPRRRQ